MAKEHQTNSDWLANKLGVVIVIIGFLGVFAGLITLWTYANHFPYPLSLDHDTWGTFGDFVGGTLNPIFGFLGLTALLLTLWVQNRELAISREELKASRIAMEQSAEAQAKSQKALVEQARIQELSLAASVVQLHGVRLRASIQAIEMQSYEVVEGARSKYAMQIENITEEMDKLIRNLEATIDKSKEP
jgi:hypothetical protein